MTSFQERVDCLKYLKSNSTNWTSGNEEIDNFIQEMQLKIGYHDDDIIFEWIPYNQFYDIKEVSKNGFITIYSVIWRDGPLYWDKQNNKYTRVPNKNVALKRLHNSQYLINFLIDEAKKYSTDKLGHEINEIYGISQIPDTNDYIFVLNNSVSLVKWTSGFKKIDDFIQEAQLKINKCDDIIFEWIPYSQFDEIKEMCKNNFMTICSAIWKNGPLGYVDRYNTYSRDSNKKITLKCLHKSQNTIEKVLNKARIYSKILDIYGISQNPATNDFILVINSITWTSGNKKIDDLVQDIQLNNKYDGIVFEWISYDRFDKIKEKCNYGTITEYSAIWKDGPLYYKRDPNQEVVLKCLHDSQNFIDFLIKKVKMYMKNYRYDNFLKLYGISQNPDTKDYIFVQNNSINWISKNEGIDDFIQEMQLKTHDFATKVFEWIPYIQFDEIKEICKNKSVSVYSAIWKDGPLYNKLYERDSNKKVILKCLHNLQNPLESLTNKAKVYSKILNIHGISQNPVSNDFILVLNNIITWESGNKFNEIKKIGESSSVTIYSAIWKDGPICKKNQHNGNHTKYARDSPNKEVILKCLHNLQDPVEFVIIDEAKKHLMKEIDRKMFKPYGISRDPDTNNLILVLGSITWENGDKIIDDFIREMRLNNKLNDIIFEWIPYNHFNEIKEVDKGEFATIFSAIWRYGPLKKQLSGDYARDSNKDVSLKCLHSSEDPIEYVKKYLTGESNKKVFKPYGISQNPGTNEFILVLNNIAWTSGNKKIDNFIQEMQLKFNDLLFEWIPHNQFNEIKEINKNNSTTICLAIWKDGPIYKNQRIGNYTRDSNKEVILRCLHNSNDFVDSVIKEARKYLVKEIDRKIFKPYGLSQNPDTNDFILILTIWKNGPLCNKNQWNGSYERDSNKVVVLKYLDNPQNLHNLINEFINKVKAYLTNMINNDNILKMYGISQDPNTKNYIIVLYYAEGGDFNNWISVNENFNHFSWKKKLTILFDIACSLKYIHGKNMFHHNFHTGNILFNTPVIGEYVNKTYISDTGLYGEIVNKDKTKIYGIIPYVAPEVLKGSPYTQAADIYSFGMIMYFVATGRQPFNNCAHDHNLVLNIYKGIRPELNESEAPKSYVDLMEKCLDSIPNNRPNITGLCQSLWSISISNSEIEKAENYRNSHLSSLMESRQIPNHSQAIYTSRLLNSFTRELQ
ncbi:kinase-like domain-containing protein [Rhizophagus clarus]|uniref:Kinase-like domain-containing protein n=1 Tax=Rhizophagus clarus TaxID=94130 RepID=A0A8H3LCN3_9GLOM|nr:kinase-like domain-containing protein [Rhizophagus clarus]